MLGINEVPTPANMLGSSTVDNNQDLSFDGSEVPYWLGGTQGTVTEAVTSIGPVAVPANTAANNAVQQAAVIAAQDPTLEDFFNPYSPYFYTNTTAPLPPPVAKKSNTLIYAGIGILAYLLLT